MGRMSDASISVTTNLFAFNRDDFEPHVSDGRPKNAPYALLMWAYYGGELRAATVDGARHLFNRVMRQEALDVDITADEAGHTGWVRVERADQLFEDSYPIRPEQLGLVNIDAALAIATAARYADAAAELTTIRRDIVDG